MIVPGDPPCPEPKAAVNKVLFSITPEAVTEGISLAEDRLESVTRVERSLLRAVQQALTNMQLHAGVQMWMTRPTERKFDLKSPELRANILQSYSDLSVMEMKKDQVRWQVVLNGLDQLKAVGQTVATAPAQ